MLNKVLWAHLCTDREQESDCKRTTSGNNGGTPRKSRWQGGVETSRNQGVTAQQQEAAMPVKGGDEAGTKPKGEERTAEAKGAGCCLKGSVGQRRRTNERERRLATGKT